MKFNKQLNHTASHLLAAAVIKLFPDVKLGFGPATSEGFYYDFSFSSPISVTDLTKIEKMMHKLASGGYKMQQSFGENYNFNDKPFKKELYNEIINRGETATFYSLLNPSNNQILFEDLCVGSHVENVSQLKHFKLISLAGAYWRGKSENEQLTRIYGTAWETKDELEEFLNILNERKERDHRKIGKDLNIFTFSDYFGQGFPVWLPNGMKIKNAIRDLVLKIDKKYGFNEVLTPHFGAKKLYETSGHLEHYKDDMFKPIEVENEELIARPMTCPHHIILFDKTKKSYNELPIRYSEQSRLYRYEKSGALTGLERVRAMDLTEGHVFVRKNQIINEFKHLYTMIKEIIDLFQIEINYVSFSKRDPKNKDKFYDDDEMWNQAENDLESVLKDLNIKYEEKIGEAAFYGPKIDFQIKTVLNHEITLSTLQLDFLLPRKFNISFINSENKKETPILIHRGLIGTYERFVSILLEQTKGNLPFWLSPKQLVVIPIDIEKHLEYAQQIYQKLFELDFNVQIDLKNERINKKIREAQISKTKYQIIVGDVEVNKKLISYRKYGESKTYISTFEKFLSKIDNKRKEYK
ncbi:threonine--tRNA ligase [Mesomycoplasma neurolyticum]|uniref:Threonine--tRNA ligase n=1 Tax=Mesomycoplasma neurolyticum TaxID=2120 RepID=A0A449A4V7_9BACT|nr:threonine--tRNA ligase [Mesomycoplasma neurolyticum]VEU59275.1 Threonine--tRNA ligase [Mesomycoplasma neurolyticum]